MENKKEMTIPNVSAATDAEQSLSKCTDRQDVTEQLKKDRGCVKAVIGNS